MSEITDQPRLNKKIDDLQRQWELLNEKLSGLNEQWILETRSEEKLRLRKLIDDTKTQRDQVEEQLKDMESQLAKVDSDAKEVTGRNGHQGQKKLKDLRVSILDSRGNKISLSDGVVDTTNGTYSVSYKADFGIRPYTIRVTTRQCPHFDYPIPRDAFQRTLTLTIPFSCGGS